MNRFPVSRNVWLKHVTLLSIWLLFISGLTAQSRLPGDDFHNGWKRSAKLRQFSSASLFQHINGGADLFLEFGFDTLWVQHYSNGQAELGADVYRMSDSEGALGVYLMKCGIESPLPGIEARNSYDRFQTSIVKGNLFIQVTNYDGDEALNPALISLVNTIMLLHKMSACDTPLFEDQLPAENRVPGSLRLVRGPVALEPIFTFGPGDILNFAGKRNAFLADYSGKTACTLIRIIYPDTESAERVMTVLNSELDPYLKKLSGNTERLTFRDYKDEFGLVERFSNVLHIRIHLKENPDTSS